MTLTHFQVIRRAARKRGACPVCGTDRYRSRTFTQTLNRFNRTSDGQIKDAQAIRTELDAEAAAWQPDFTCATHPEEDPA